MRFRHLAILALFATQALAAEPAPGLVLELAAADGEVNDARAVRLPALAVSEGEPVSPLIGSVPFTAVFRGALNLPLRTRLSFRIIGTGKARLTIGEETLLGVEGKDLGERSTDMRRFRKGATPFRLEYDSPPAGVARVVLLWSGRDFIEEPVPPSVFTHDPDDGRLVAGARLRRGRELFAAARCIRCHAWRGDFAHAMPELGEDATSFEGMQKRLQRDWIAAWTADPKGLRADATMPALLGVSGLEAAAADGDTRPWDLAAYLGADDDAGAPPAFSAVAGAELFDALGCIGCHALGAASDERISLQEAAWKFIPGAIARFLQAPRAHRASSPMPDFGLTEAEAGALENFLRSRARPARMAIENAPAGDAERGRALAEELGCAACHEASKDQSVLRAPALDEVFEASWLQRGCARGGEGLPDYSFEKEDLAALETLRVAGVEALGRDPASEAATRLVASLSCGACHARDTTTDRWSQLVTETLNLRAPDQRPALEQRRPDLTWAGDKLQESWIQRILEGDPDTRSRPFLEARMPAFTQHAGVLARGLALEHGHLPGGGATHPVQTEPDDVELGRMLTGMNGGFACGTCHPIGGQPGLVQFEMGAIDLDLAPHRLRPDYARRWLLDPTRIDPATKMPRFVDAMGKSALSSVLDGDGRAQMEAILGFVLGTR